MTAERAEGVVHARDQRATERRSRRRPAVLLGWSGEAIWADPLRRRLLAAADAVAVGLAIVTISLFGADTRALLYSAAAVPAGIVLSKTLGLYDRDHKILRHLTIDEVSQLFIWALIIVGALALFVDSAEQGVIDLGTGAWLLVVTTVAVVALRGAARHAWRRLTPRERTAVIGNGLLASATTRKLELFPDIHVDVVMRLETLEATHLDSLEWLDGLQRVIVASEFIDEGIIALMVRECRHRRIKFSMVPPARGMFGTAVHLTHVADLAVIDYNTWEVGPSTLMLKRAIDLALAGLVLTVTLPLFVAIAVAIKLDDRGPVFFVQRRAGREGRPFRMVKFRTMSVDAEERLKELISFDELDAPMFKLPNDPRVTRVGKLLRRASLDELPQLLNVIRGSMSIVGPRPEQVDLVERYEPAHRFRLDVKPGLTGPMQVFGRGALTFDERLAVEREYIENLSIGRDLRILGLTLAPLVTGRGAT